MAKSKRKLAAIMFTDIEGYTSLMGSNSEKTLELVKINNGIQKPLVQEYSGKWVKEMGDGTLAEFASALDAVKCAIEIQKEAYLRLEPKLRIGIHLGDVTTDGDEIYGDGVNLASRIESVAEPGTIYISEAVRGAIKGSGIDSSFKGHKKFKNVEDPVGVYKIDQESDTTLEAGKKRKSFRIAATLIIAAALFGIWKLTDRSPNVTEDAGTIAILPLQMENPDSSNLFLVQAITEELINSVGKLNVLSVINPNSTRIFSASISPVKEASQQLDESDYFLTGTIVKNDNLLDLDISLFDDKEVELWNNTYQGDIFEIQSIAGTIAIDLAEFIHAETDEEEISRLVDISPVDPDLFKKLLLGKNHLAKFTPQDIAIGLSYLQQAVNEYPSSSRAWSMLAEGLIMMGHSPSPPPGVWEESRAAATRAIQLDSMNAEAWAWLATTKTYYHWDYDGAQYCYSRANALNNNLPMSHYHYSWHLLLFDSLDKAIDEHEIAFRLDPLDPFQSARLGHIYLLAGKLDSAMVEIRRSNRLQPDFVIAENVKGQIYLAREQYDSAAICFEKTGIFGGGFLASTYWRSGRREKAMEIIRELESNINSYNAFSLALFYQEINEADKFFEYANYPQPHAFHPWLRVAVTNPEIIRDARFKPLMDKMNLPMPGE